MGQGVSLPSDPDSPCTAPACALMPPGVLSGEKQRIERNYNFVDIASWFASRCDLIFMLFDPTKLDISDEFKQVGNGQGRDKGHVKDELT